MGLSKIRKQFFNFNFYGEHLSQRQVCFFEISIKFSIFFIPNMTYFKKKNFHLSEEQILKFFNTKTEKDRNTTK
jgi:hypothetical protein